jgi:PEGA domain
MRTKTPLVLGCVTVAWLAAVLPSPVEAQRHRGGSGRLSTAVPRAAHPRPHYPRSYYPRYHHYSRYYYPRFHYPGYYYPRYYYPRYYHPGYYPGYYYPGFSFGVGIGFGVGFGVGYGYGYPAYPGSYYAPYAYGQYTYDRPIEPRIQVTPPVYQSGDSAPSGQFGTLSIRAQPADAEIFVDGEQWHFPESDRRLVLEISEGPHRVEIRRAGLEPYATTIYIRPGQTTTLNVSLTRGSLK